MSTATFQSAYADTPVKTSVIAHFSNWCEKQQSKRLFWLGLALGLQGCVLLPLSMMASLLAGTNLVLLLMTFASIVMNVIVNLAAMPTKITIPVFFLGILIDIAVIISALSIGMDFHRLFG